MERSPHLGTSARRRENTRARLLEAGREVFAEKGIRRVTVDELVAAAGYTRGAFYSNFSSIEEVFFAVFEDQAQQMLAAVREAIHEVPPDEFRMDSLGGILERLHPLGRQWYLVLTEFMLMALRNEEARGVLADHSRRFRAELVEVITDVLSRLDRRATIPVEQLGEATLALYLHSIAEEELGDPTLGTAELIGNVLPGLLLGFSTPRTEG